MFGQRLIIVSGKGGVGKTAIASALARVSARERPTALVTFDTQLERHPFFGIPIGYEPVSAAPDLAVLRVDGLSAIQEYVRRKVPFSRFYEAFFASRMFRDFAEAAPGFEELMCLGKLYDLVTESAFERVIFDAPSTGHLKTLVDVPAATLEVVLVGPLNHNARKIQDLLLDPDRTRVVLTTLAEEMAVREALELETFCRERRMRVGPIVVNQTVPARFSENEILALRGIADPSPVLEAGIAAAAGEFELVASQTSALETLGESRTPVWQVPRCFAPDSDGLLGEIVSALEQANASG